MLQGRGSQCYFGVEATSELIAVEQQWVETKKLLPWDVWLCRDPELCNLKSYLQGAQEFILSLRKHNLKASSCKQSVCPPVGKCWTKFGSILVLSHCQCHCLSIIAWFEGAQDPVAPTISIEASCKGAQDSLLYLSRHDLKASPCERSIYLPVEKRWTKFGAVLVLRRWLQLQVLPFEGGGLT